MGTLVDSGEKRLKELGYKQELKRDLSFVSNFAFSFAIISVLTGITTLFNTGLTYGGPISMVYGWLIAGSFSLLVGLSLAEICSSFPTSGGLYFWSFRLSGRKWGPFAAWMTGWYNLVGQWATTTSVDFSLATLLQVIILLATGGANGGGLVLSKYAVIGLHGGILILHGLINCLPISWLSFFGTLAVAWNCIGVFLLMILIPTVAGATQSSEFVFTSFNRDNGVGIHSPPYIFVLGMLMTMYTITGFDASAHMSEETKTSDKNGSYGIIGSIAVSVVVGFGYILGITYSIPSTSELLDPGNDAGGYAIAQLFYQIFKNRYGSGAGGIVCLCIVAGAVFLCGVSCVTSNSRMAFAFSRDGAMPLSSVWHVVNKDEVPVNAVWLAVFMAFVMALPSLGSVVAFNAMVSVASVGLYISYALPIFFRLTVGRRSFVPGPFNLGRFSSVVGWIAVAWAVVLTVIFCLPLQYPIKRDTLNYAPVAVGGVFLLVVTYWILSARYWFKGPQTNLTAETNVPKKLYAEATMPLHPSDP